MIPADVRIFLCTEPVDMRRSFDGLALAARERLGQDPRQGGLFAFVNRRAKHATFSIPIAFHCRALPVASPARPTTAVVSHRRAR